MVMRMGKVMPGGQTVGQGLSVGQWSGAGAGLQGRWGDVVMFEVRWEVSTAAQAWYCVQA